MYLVFRCDQHAGAWLEAYFAGFGSGVGDLAMGVDVGEGGHGRTIEKTIFLARMSQSPRWTTIEREVG